MRIFAILLTALLLVSAGTVDAQTAQQLTPEQQRMLNMLPAAQRAQVLRQMRQYPGQQSRARTSTDAATTDGAADELVTPEGTRDPAESPTEIRAFDTLIIEVDFKPLELGEFAETIRATEEHLLKGLHTVTLDQFGRLSMPGLDSIPLAGLNPEQAAKRLMAEPALKDMEVEVTRLSLRRYGRDSLEPFGYRVFDGGSDYERQRVEATMPVPGDYMLGPGDTLSVYFYGKEAVETELEVMRDGSIRVPHLGPMQVAGRQLSEVRTLIENGIREQTIGIQASVTMGRLRTIEVFVIGEVERPGSHLIGGVSTVMNALNAAGGVTVIGSLRNIRVLRGGALQRRFDLYSLLLDGDASDDVRLYAGDVVFVPPTGSRAGVTGEALRTAWFELTDRTTLGDLIEHAGGGSPESDIRQAKLHRIGADGRVRVIELDLTRDADRNRPARPSDVIMVPRRAETVAETIRLRGHFEFPGTHEWRPGMRISEVFRSDSVLRRAADLDYGLVVRRDAKGHGVTVRMFAPRAVMRDPGSSDDFELHELDEIYAFAYDDTTSRRALMEPLIERLRSQATGSDIAPVVEIGGAVRAPGFYPLAPGMRITDLVRAGGGLAESAYHHSAEITRYEVGTGDLRRTEHLEVHLADALNYGGSSNIELQPHDVLTVKQMPQWTDYGHVELRGEVRFPGIYPIRPGEHISDIIDRAGGLTDFAYMRAAVFTRETLREREQEQIDNMITRLEADIATAATRMRDQDAQQAQSIAQSVVQQLRNTPAVGRLVINLSRLIDNPANRDYDVLARDGDVLVVPPRPQEVTVLGEVYFPTSHIYDPELDRDGFVRRSGGVTSRADTKRIYIVRADGAVEAAGGRFMRRGVTTINPGDTIVVPVDADRLPPMARVMNITQILYQLSVAAAALQTIGAL